GSHRHRERHARRRRRNGRQLHGVRALSAADGRLWPPPIMAGATASLHCGGGRDAEFPSLLRGDEQGVTNLRLTKQLAGLAEPLDEVAEPVQEAIQAIPKPVRDILDGVWFGNPLHAALTDVPIGAWTAA